MPAIVTTGVRLAPPFGDVVVPDVSVPARGVTLLEGRNGSGKSAFVELCAGTLRAVRGSVRVLDLDPADPRSLGRRSVCRTSVALAQGASVRQHVRLFARHARVPESTYLARLRAHGSLDWVDVPTQRLSTGLARLAWVVLATTPQRALMLLDEPFLGLDDEAARILHGEIDAWARAGSVVLVDHGGDRAWTGGAHRIAMGTAR
ncbi:MULTISPECIES: ATP-binding cassette domain-containing protein [unclassified Agrococcus]|uniref:ATP-binding cassette domain-containing protein n=1 Tax=unclassified Agrococcus TaxID=2615065 RepID=UPI0036090E0A